MAYRRRGNIRRRSYGRGRRVSGRFRLRRRSRRMGTRRYMLVGNRM